ncbi:hypothetical protein WN943_007833 [Citrus x changshan-huyou]
MVLVEWVPNVAAVLFSVLIISLVRLKRIKGDITDDLAVSYAVHQLPSLHKAVYYVMFSEWPPIDRRPPVQLLAGMTKTKCLTLSAGVLHALNRRGDNIFPQFSALTYLHVTVGQFGCTMLPTILGCSPNLHTFVLHLSDWYVLNDEQTRWTDTATVPSCLSDHVNIIEINGLGKENSHMRLAEYLLNHSRVLLTMTVRCKPSVDGKTLENLHHRLMGLHRGCASAFIHLTRWYSVLFLFISCTKVTPMLLLTIDGRTVTDQIESQRHHLPPCFIPNNVFIWRCSSLQANDPESSSQ